MNQDNRPSIIPFRINKSVEALNSLAKNEDYFVTDPKEGYMCTVEYIVLSTGSNCSELKVSVYDFNADPKGQRIVTFDIKTVHYGTHFFTKLRMMPGERLNIKAMGTQGSVNVHVSGYYELIPQL
jgi:hypothetical protein